ncbi:MAG: PmoA family protein [Pirellulaceae bacterium]
MLRIAAVVALLLALAPFVQAADKFQVERQDDGVTVKLDGKLLTRYLIKSGHKPILWPVIGPNGEEMTRAYPMRDAGPDEKSDHIHHRSFWFTHGNVNGVDFWAETADAGDIIHREFVKVEGGDTATIVTKNDWIDREGKKHCEDERTFVFHSDGKRWWVDCDITVFAPKDRECVFGDTKEGSFGVRVAGSMKVTADKGGEIVNSNGEKNAEAWGKPAAWVDYHGPVNGKTVGVAILNHPSSFRHPTHWHVRTYGLFTANPFGLHDFPGGKEKNGSHTLQPGESFTLRHRVLFHDGDEKQANIAAAYAEYAK